MCETYELMYQWLMIKTKGLKKEQKIKCKKGNQLLMTL